LEERAKRKGGVRKKGGTGIGERTRCVLGSKKTCEKGRGEGQKEKEKQRKRLAGKDTGEEGEGGHQGFEKKRAGGRGIGGSIQKREHEESGALRTKTLDELKGEK